MSTRDEWSDGQERVWAAGSGDPQTAGAGSAPGAGSASGAGAAGTGTETGAGTWAAAAAGTPMSPYTGAGSPHSSGAATSRYASVPQVPAGYSFDRAPAASLAPDPFSARPGWAAPQTATGPASDGTQPSGSGQRRGPGWSGVIATSLVTAMLACGGTVAALHHLDDAQAGTTAVSTASAQPTGGTTQVVAPSGTSPDWETVTQAVANSVVSITVATPSGTSVGSGVVYDAAGHILTNHHVVAGATRIQVTLADGRIYDAELTGSDAATDLAVIQLVNAPGDLTVARFGDSDAVVTGQDVMAIGNPLGLSSTVTTGIVSALNRPVVTSRQQDEGSSQVVTNAIQIDAAVNPGNSGGPLFDESGSVIGITSSIASMGSSGDSGSIGIGFAIPSMLATKVADQLIETGTATHAFLGVSITNGEARTDTATYAGALVGAVESGSPADRAGVEEGDVITAVNGKATSQSAALTGFVRQFSAGQEVTLTVVRSGQTLELTATLAERRDS